MMAWQKVVSLEDFKLICEFRPKEIYKCVKPKELPFSFICEIVEKKLYRAINYIDFGKVHLTVEQMEKLFSLSKNNWKSIDAISRICGLKTRELKDEEVKFLVEKALSNRTLFAYLW